MACLSPVKESFSLCSLQCIWKLGLCSLIYALYFSIQIRYLNTWAQTHNYAQCKITHSPPLSGFAFTVVYTLCYSLSHTHTHTLAWKLHFPASRDYGAMTVTCWDGGDTLSRTKEINFPVTWPSCKAALKRREGLLSPSRFFVGQIMAQQKKQLHYLCISVNPPSLMCTRGNDVKIGSRRWKSGK